MALSKIYILDCPSYGVGFDDCRRFSTMSDAIAAAEILASYLREPVKVWLCRSLNKRSQYIGIVNFQHGRPYFCTAQPNNPYFIRSLSAYI